MSPEVQSPQPNPAELDNEALVSRKSLDAGNQAEQAMQEKRAVAASEATDAGQSAALVTANELAKQVHELVTSPEPLDPAEMGMLDAMRDQLLDMNEANPELDGSSLTVEGEQISVAELQDRIDTRQATEQERIPLFVPEASVAHELLTKEDLTAEEQVTLEGVMNTLRQEKVTSPKSSDTEIANDTFSYANVGELISAIALKLNEESIKVVEDTIDASAEDTRSENFKETVEKATQLWAQLVEKQNEIAAIKTSFFGPNVKFVGKLPPSYNGNDTGLLLKNGEKLAKWLNKKGRNSEAETVVSYEDDVTAFQIATADALGSGLAFPSNRAMDRSKTINKPPSGFIKNS